MTPLPPLSARFRIPPLALAATGILMGVILDAIIKHLGAGYTAILIAALRYAFGSILSGGAVLALRRRLPDAKTLRAHGIRAVASTVSAVLFFHCLSILPLAEATVMILCAPLMIAPLAQLVLKERMRPFAMLALAVGFAGVIIAVYDPAGGAEAARRVEGMASGLGGAGLYALSIVLLRQLAQKDDTMVTAFLGNIFPALYLLPVAAVLGVAPQAADLPLFALAGAVGFLLWLFLTEAYARAPAQSLAATEYTALIWSALVGYLLFAEIPRWQLWVGAGVIIAGVALSAVDGRRARRPAPPPADG